MTSEPEETPFRLEERSGGVALQGEMDLASEARLLDALTALCDAGGDVTVDLSELTFIDSVGISVLVRVAKALQPGCRLILAEPQPMVQRVFELVELQGIPGIDVTTPIEQAS